jgi:hypothetical protein
MKMDDFKEEQRKPRVERRPTQLALPPYREPARDFLQRITPIANAPTIVPGQPMGITRFGDAWHRHVQNCLAKLSCPTCHHVIKVDPPLIEGSKLTYYRCTINPDHFFIRFNDGDVRTNQNTLILGDAPGMLDVDQDMTD